MSLVHHLPQDDPNPETRSTQLASSRETWTYAWDWPVGVATNAELAKSDKYDLRYAAHSLDAYLAIAANLVGMAREGLDRGDLLAVVKANIEKSGPSKLHEHLLSTPKELVGKVPDKRPEHWTSFTELYAAWEAPDVVGAMTADGGSRADASFAWQRIGGVNPMVLARCAELPDHLAVDEAVFARSGSAGDSLAAARAEGRLFLADYAALDGLEAGVTDGVQKYLTAPLALFVGGPGGGALRPVAVQLEQTPDRGVLTPADGWRWWSARAWVQVADANMHEAFAHLGRTHLVMEAVHLALHRELAERHPLFPLLAAHVETTAAINHSAKTSLIAPGGTVDRCFAPTIESFGTAVKAALDSYPLDQTDPRADLRARGLDDTGVLPVHPYRDDVLPVWDALDTYLGEVVDLYYASDAVVAADTELQAFVRAIGASDAGRLVGVPSARTRAELRYLLTRLIFIAGPQHSAVNFTQFPNMGFPPNMPGASYRAVGTGDGDEQAFTDMLPSWRIALEDTTMVYLLSNVRASKLGEYGLLQFSDLKMHPIMRRFQSKLATVEQATIARDVGRFSSYPYLRPSQILQSISI